MLKWRGFFNEIALGTASSGSVTTSATWYCAPISALRCTPLIRIPTSRGYYNISKFKDGLRIPRGDRVSVLIRKAVFRRIVRIALCKGYFCRINLIFMDTKLVIFDLDGTLLDTIDDLAAATNHALQQNGYPAHERSAYRYFVGNGITRLVERACPKRRETKNRRHAGAAGFRGLLLPEHNTDRTRPIRDRIAGGENRGTGASVWPSRRTNIRRPPPN